MNALYSLTPKHSLTYGPSYHIPTKLMLIMFLMLPHMPNFWSPPCLPLCPLLFFAHLPLLLMAKDAAVTGARQTHMLFRSTVTVIQTFLHWSRLLGPFSTQLDDISSLFHLISIAWRHFWKLVLLNHPCEHQRCNRFVALFSIQTQHIFQLELGSTSKTIITFFFFFFLSQRSFMSHIS